MPTASYLIDDMQVKLGDPSGLIYTSANLLNWLNGAQTDFCEKAMPLRRIDATTVGTGFNRFPIPSDKIMIEGVFSRYAIGIKLKALTFTDWNTQVAACPGAVGYDSDSWTEFDQTLYVHPAYGVASKSTLCPIGESSTATTIRVLSTTGFKSWGRLLTTSGEEIEYTSMDSTHFYGCTRGVGGTTAATIFKGSRITQCDLWIVYRRAAQDMATGADVPEIRSVYHEKLEYYAMYLAYKQTGEEEKSRDMYALWMEALKAAQYSAMREHLSPIGLEDINSQGWNSLNGAR